MALQLKLEACNLAERDLWVSALDEAVRRRRTPPLAAEVEEERWARREKAELDSQRRASAERRRDNEAMRSRMAQKYGLDPDKYVSRRPRQRSTAAQSSTLGGDTMDVAGGSSTGGGGVGSVGGGGGGSHVVDHVSGIVSAAGGGGVLKGGVPFLKAIAQ